MLEIVREVGNDILAKVYVANMNGRLIEFAESIQPPLTREEKWVLIISCLYGCPVKCLMCDAGQQFFGKMNKEEMFEQIDYLVRRRYPDGNVPSKKFKIQFTRMGEPAFNLTVLEVLEELPERYNAPGLIPSVSTVGPKNGLKFLRALQEIKSRLYGDGRFQLQFSIHTTDEKRRDELIPIKKLSFDEIAKYGKTFYVPGDRKITLNFIVMEEYPIEPKIIARHFDPRIFMVKLTPLNPTTAATKSRLVTKLNPHDEESVSTLVSELQRRGFDTIVSVGPQEENRIGSNCGQYVSGKLSESFVPIERVT